MFSHPIQWIHAYNVVMGLALTGSLIASSATMQSFIQQGSAAAGFGNYNIFSYPASLVYMMVVSVCSLVFNLILVIDQSPAYEAWRPSRTRLGLVATFTLTTLLAALLPVIPGADVMTAPDAAIECSWRNYMSWRTTFDNPDVFPWVLDADAACTCFQAADGFCWLLTVGWCVLLSLLAIRRHASSHRSFESNKTRWRVDSGVSAFQDQSNPQVAQRVTSKIIVHDDPGIVVPTPFEQTPPKRSP